MKRRSQLAWRWCGIVAAIAGLVACVAQRDAMARANAEHQMLLKESEEAERLARENGDLEKQRAIYEEVKRLREGRTELARLRGEWERLRAQAEAAEKMRAENEQLESAANGETNLVPANFISRAAMADVGLGSPEATVQTFFQAMVQGDLARLQLFRDARVEPSPEILQEEGESMRKEFAQFPGFAITEENMISADEAQIGVVAITGGVVYKLHLIRVGDQWNVK